MMKNNLKYIILLTMVLVLSSCGKDFLTIVPADKVTADGFYKNESQVRSGTASLYGAVWFAFNDKFFWVTGDCLSGNYRHNWDQEGQFFLFSFTEGNSHLNTGWQALYRVISYSNSIINDVAPIASANVSATVVNQAIGEARFMRATAYFFLAEFWGDVPIVENATELVSSNNLILPKNTKASVYEFMRRDLEFAAANLATSDVPGRVTKWSAEGMLAKLYLTMAQQGIGSDSYAKAMQYADDVITNSGLSLMTNYEDLFKIENNNNPESLFAFQFMSGSYGIGNSRQANWGRSSTVTGNTECWGSGDGCTYDFVKFSDSLYTSKGDVRHHAIFMRDGDYYPEMNKANGGYTYHIVTYDPLDNSKTIENASALLNNAKKYIVGSSADNNGNVSTGQATGLNQYALRLADVYLIYAEAACGASGSTADGKAISYLNTVRNRAKMQPFSGTLTFETVFNERRIEFCLEGISWMDVKRFYYRNPTACLAYLNSQKRTYNYYRDQAANAAPADQPAGYILQSGTPITVDASKMVLPIPGAEVLQNPKLAKGVDAVEYQFNN